MGASGPQYGVDRGAEEAENRRGHMVLRTPLCFSRTNIDRSYRAIDFSPL